MWQQLVDQKDEWIGGRLIDYGDEIDRALFDYPLETVIVDIELTERTFHVIGEEFTCGGGRQYVGIMARPEFEVPENGLAITGYGGHEWHIVKPAKDGEEEAE
jgi:hypothetical protein